MPRPQLESAISRQGWRNQQLEAILPKQVVEMPTVPSPGTQTLVPSGPSEPKFGFIITTYPNYIGLPRIVVSHHPDRKSYPGPKPSECMGLVSELDWLDFCLKDVDLSVASLSPCYMSDGHYSQTNVSGQS